MASSSSSTAAMVRVDRPLVEHGAGRSGLRSLILRQPGGYSAEILLYGGQVISWKNEREEEMLFLSQKAVFGPPNPVRGGIPICFPKFFNNGNIEQHGFARIRFWKIDTSVDATSFPPPTTDNAFVDLIMDPMPIDFKHWPNRFELRLRVILGPTGDLTMTSRIRNLNSTDEKSRSFTVPFSYHTYFSISDINEIRIEGLEAVDYLDYLQDKKKFTEQDVSVFFEESEVDRVYLTPDNTVVAVIDHERRRTYIIRKNFGLPDLVVWNPWETKAKKMTDLDNNEYKEMVCVEAAALENLITLKPGEEWIGTQSLSVEASNYSEERLQPGTYRRNVI